MTALRFRVGLVFAAVRRQLDRWRRIDARCESCGLVLMRRGHHVERWLYTDDDVELCVPCWDAL